MTMLVQKGKLWNRFFLSIINISITFFVFNLLAINSLSAQAPKEQMGEELILNLPPLPSLDSLTRAALQYSADLKIRDKWVEVRAKEQQIKKKDILDKISIGGSAFVGTGTIYDAWTDGQYPSEFTSYRRDIVYNTGIQIRFTAGDVAKNKQQKELTQLLLEKAMMERLAVEQQIREEVIRRYDDFNYCLTMIDIKVANLEAMRLSLEIAEQYFKDGNLPTAEYSTILSKKIKAEEELLTAKARTVHCWRSLKEFCDI